MHRIRHALRYCIIQGFRDEHRSAIFSQSALAISLSGMTARGTFLTIRFGRDPRSERPVRVAPSLTQKLTSPTSFDHLVGAGEQRR